MSQQHYGQIQLATLAGAESYTFVRDAKSRVPVLEELAQINLFVGPNNSGKSRLIRALFRAGKYRFNPSGFNWNQVVYAARQLEWAINTLLGTHPNLRGYGSVTKNFTAGLIRDEFLVDSEADIEQLRQRVLAMQDERNFNAIFDSGSIGPMDPGRVKMLHDAEIKPKATELAKVLDTFRVKIGGEPHP